MLRDSTDKLDVTRQAALADAGECAVEFVKARPECRLKKWDGEADIGVRYAISAQLEELSSERVKWGSGDLHVEAYTLPSGPGMEDGGLEIEIVLSVQPPTNRFEFTIDGSADYDWWFQPSLTPRQIQQGRNRPDSVIGSYAVYHKARRNHISGQKNYATGKAFHVYRPKLIDADGVETWGTLSYADGVLTVEIPQEALDKAVYPARIDPTFGYTSIGGSTFFFGGTIWAHIGTPSGNGAVNNIQAYVNADAGNIKGVVFLASTKVIVSNGITPAYANSAATAWKLIDYTTEPTVTGGTAYYAGVIAETNAPDLAYDSGGTTDQDWYDEGNSYATPADPTGGVSNDEHPSVYANFTETGGGGGSTHHIHLPLLGVG